MRYISLNSLELRTEFLKLFFESLQMLQVLFFLGNPVSLVVVLGLADPLLQLGFVELGYISFPQFSAVHLALEYWNRA